MDISYCGLIFLTAGEPVGGPVLNPILLTSLSHVNRHEHQIVLRRTQNGALGSFLSNGGALRLTVAHKTVAERL